MGFNSAFKGLKYVLLMERVCNMQPFQVLIIFCHLFFVNVYSWMYGRAAIPFLLNKNRCTGVVWISSEWRFELFNYFSQQNLIIKSAMKFKILNYRPRRRWVDNIKMDLQQVGCGYMDWVGLTQDRDRWRTLVSEVMNLRVPWNTGNFLTSCKPVSCSRRTLHHGVSR